MRIIHLHLALTQLVQVRPYGADLPDAKELSVSMLV